MSVVNEERNYTVYMHVNKENEKTYIGITCQSLKNRWRKNGEGYKQNTYFYNAIQKYGWDNFQHIILFENKTKKQAEELEILYIKILLSSNRIYGYNIEHGGKSVGTISEETKNKLRDANINKGHRIICDNIIFNNIKQCATYYKINYNTMRSWLNGKHMMPIEFQNKGLKFSDKPTKIKKELYPIETRERMSSNKKDLTPWNKGKKTGLIPWNKGKTYSYEIRKKMSISHKGCVPWNKGSKNGLKGSENGNSTKIFCITTNKLFLSIIEACKEYNIKSSSNVVATINGRQKTCGKLEDGTKLMWRYATEEDLNTYELVS